MVRGTARRTWVCLDWRLLIAARWECESEWWQLVQAAFPDFTLQYV